MAARKHRTGNDFTSFGVIAENRKARRDYEIIDDLEAGLVLRGSEVKALRLRRCALVGSYAGLRAGELYLFNMHIGEYDQARPDQHHESKRARKLLVKRRELKRLIGQIERAGMTLVPLRLYFNGRGCAKVLLGLGRGKKTVDKRETIKQREWNRKKARVLKKTV